jgi:hypothetical protein
MTNILDIAKQYEEYKQKVTEENRQRFLDAKTSFGLGSALHAMKNSAISFEDFLAYVLEQEKRKNDD